MKYLSQACRFPFCLTGVFLYALLAGGVFPGLASLSHAAATQPAAASWQTVISGHPASPPYLIAVDKSRQQLSFFERHSPLKLSRMFFSTTGQAVGDKIVEGDLKTPEGVYFVVQRIGSGLDFLKYGNEAYTLNYPNPVDRLRRKTGYGIWIHGRGEPLVPLQTEGCVAMDNGELALLGRLLVPGTPVALTESFAFAVEGDKEQAATANELRRKVKEWAEAWSARSHAYFDFYDKPAYSLAQGEPFSAFQAQKERLFKHLPWIKTTVSDIQALQGPGYWVTWFYQDYQAPNLSTRGVRRLYWSKDGKGEFKILGMEWLPGMNASTLVASSGPLLPPLEATSRAAVPAGWSATDSGAPGSYGVVAAAEGRLPVRRPLSDSPGLVASSGPSDGVPAEAVPAPETPPITTSATDADAVLLASGSGADAKAQPPSTTQPDSKSRPFSTSDAVSAKDSAASAALALAEGAAYRSADHVEDPAFGVMARPSQEAVRLAREERLRKRDEQAGDLRVAVNEKSGQGGMALPPPLPAQGLAEPSQASPEARQAVKPQREPQQQVQVAGVEQAPAQVSLEPQQADQTQPASQEAAPPATDNDLPPASAVLAATAAAQSSLSAAEVALSDEELASRVIAAVQSWRAAWEQGDLDAYMACYAPKAKQGTRKSAEDIRRQKEDLWNRAKPASVLLEDMRVSVQGDTARVVMRQEYADEKGNGDTGRKTLSLALRDGAWLITQEDWSALSHETSN
jgi:murein L,D-transpeptidase YafK